MSIDILKMSIIIPKYLYKENHMYSCVYEGKVLDFHFKKCKVAPYIYDFSVGNIHIGQIFKRSKTHWSAVSFHKNNPGKTVYGFGCRMAAAEYLLNINGFNGEKHNMYLISPLQCKSNILVELVLATTELENLKLHVDNPQLEGVVRILGHFKKINELLANP